MDELSTYPSEPRLRDYVNVLRRRKMLLLAAVAVCLSGGYLLTARQKPLYQTRVRILVKGNTSNVAQYDVSNPMSNILAPEAEQDVATQIQALQGVDMLAEVFQRAGVIYDKTKLPQDQEAGKVQARQVEMTNVIEITFEARQKDVVARMSQVMPGVYTRYLIKRRQSDLDRALRFVGNRLAIETKNLAQAETALSLFKRKAQFVNLERERDAKIDQSGTLAKTIQGDQLEVSNLEATLEALITIRSSLPETVENATTATNTGIDTIRDRIGLLKTQRTSLLVLHKPNNPRVQEIDQQIADQEAYLARIPTTITTVNSTRNPSIDAYDIKIREVEVALAGKNAELARAQSHGNVASRELSQYSEYERRQASLLRDIERNKEMTALLSKTLEDLQLRKNAVSTPVVSLTSVGAITQAAPRLIFNLAVATLLGLAIGIACMMLAEFTDDRIYEANEVRALFDVPTLSVLPLLTRASLRSSVSRDSDLLEAVRVLRSHLIFAAAQTPIHSLLISSSVPGEGKSFVATQLARSLAMDGKRVVLVDANLYAPVQHEAFGIARTNGLRELLTKQITLKQAYQASGMPNLQIIPAGTPTEQTTELLNSVVMQRLHQQLKEQADIVIFDGPAFSETVDASLLAAIADHTILTCCLGMLRRPALYQTAERMAQAQARLIGCVFNGVKDATALEGAYAPFSDSYKRMTAFRPSYGETKELTLRHEDNNERTLVSAILRAEERHVHAEQEIEKRRAEAMAEANRLVEEARLEAISIMDEAKRRAMQVLEIANTYQEMSKVSTPHTIEHRGGRIL